MSLTLPPLFMSKPSSYKPGFENLEQRDVPSTATETMRVPDVNQPDIVGITKQTTYDITTAFGTQGMQDQWSYTTRVNGQDSDPGYTTPVLNQENAYGVGSEAAPEVIRVQHKFTFEKLSSNQVKVTWENIDTRYADNIELGSLGSQNLRYAVDGSRVFTVPQTGYQYSGILFWRNGSPINLGNFGIQNGVFVQDPPSGTQTVPNIDWNRTVPNRDINFLMAKNASGSDRAIASTTWKAGEVAVHPSDGTDAVFMWQSPSAGRVNVEALLKDMQLDMGDGVTYTFEKTNANNGSPVTLRTGVIANAGTLDMKATDMAFDVAAGDKLRLTISGKGSNNDVHDTRGDMTSIVLKPSVTEAEKSFEKVIVAPSFTIRATDDKQSVFVDYRNFPEGSKIRAHRAGTQWSDGNWGKWEVPVSGTGTYRFPIRSEDRGDYLDVDIYVVSPDSDNDPVEDKKTRVRGVFDNHLNILQFNSVPTTRQMFGSMGNEVLKDKSIDATELDLAEQTVVIDYRNSQLLPPPVYDWTEGKSFNYIDRARQFGVINLSDLNGPLRGTGGTYKVLFSESATQYQMHTLVSDGYVRINRLWYVTDTGLKKLPRNYYTILENGNFITKPNVPGHVVYDMSLNGTFAGGPGQTAAKQEEILLPYKGQKVSGWVDKLVADISTYEGFQPMLTEIRDVKSAVLNPGAQVHVMTQLQSVGTQGGAMTLNVYCGYTGDVTKDQLQKTFQTTFDVNTRRSLVFNVAAPNNPPTENSRAQITMEVVYADGRKEILVQKLAPASRPREIIRKDPITGKDVIAVIDYTREELAQLQRLVQRISTLTGKTPPTFVGDTSQGKTVAFNSYYERVAEEMLAQGKTSTPTATAGERLAMAGSAINKELFTYAASPETIEQNMQNPDAVDAVTLLRMQQCLDISRQNPQNTTYRSTITSYLKEAFSLTATNAESAADAITKTAPTSFQSALGWFDQTRSVEGMSYFVRKDTAMGRIFAGFMQQIQKLPSFADHTTLARGLENITGISIFKILKITERSNGDKEKIALLMRELFAYAQYDHIFMPPQAGESDIMYAHASRDRSNPYKPGEVIRMRFDVKDTALNADHFASYVWQNGAQVDLVNSVSGNFSGKLYVDIPASAVTRQLKTSSGEVQLSIVGWIPLQNQSGMRTSVDHSENLVVPQKILGLSANPDPAKAKVENEVLSQIYTNTPFRRSDASWSVTLGSGYHDDNIGSFHAIDIGAGTADIGKDVLAIAGGVISSIDLTYGTIVIDHAAIGAAPAWQSVVLHTPIYKTTRIASNGNPIYVFKNKDRTEVPGLEVWKGKPVIEAEKIAIVSGRGRAEGVKPVHGVDEEGKNFSDEAFDEHIHQEGRLNGKSINLANLLMDAHGWNLPVKADDGFGGKRDAVWSTEVDVAGLGGAWVNKTDRIIFYRNPSITDDTKNDIWIAWHSDATKRFQIRWDKEKNNWFRWDAILNDWYKESSRRSKWQNNAWTLE